MKGNSGTRSVDKTHTGRNRSALDSVTEAYIDAYNNFSNLTNEEFNKVRDAFNQKWNLYNEEYRKIEDEYESKYWKKHDLGYTQEQKDVMNEYARNSYRINEAAASSSPSAEMKEKIRVLDSCFRPAEKDIIVYKGWFRGDLENSKGYASTSVLPTFARRFASASGGIAAFRIPKGTPIIRISMREDEILLPRNFNIKKYRIK